jgi:hypothetical protein
VKKKPRHKYPSFAAIRIKVDKHLTLTAEEELLHYVDIDQFSKKEARRMLQEWFPAEKFTEIV